MSEEWDDARVLVTGGASGIGAATSLLLAERGAIVTILDVDDDGLRRTVTRAATKRGRVISLVGDVSDEADRASAVRAAAGDTGRLDLLVNNAAVFLLAGLDATAEQWSRTLAVNLLAPAALVAQARSYLAKSPRPAVVNVASISAHVAQAGRWTYNAAKGGLLELTRCQALDLANDHIRVNSVSPGWIWTEALEQASHNDRATWEKVWGGYAIADRCGEPSEVAEAIAFLGGPGASFINGTDLRVDGGYLALGPEGRAGIELQR